MSRRKGPPLQRESARKRQAQQGLEELAAKCIPGALMALSMEEGGVTAGVGIRWDRAGVVAADVALAIRLQCRANVDRLFETDEGRETVEELALVAVQKAAN